MAGDWIKMRTDLHEDPAVIRIADDLGIPEEHVVGCLHRLWSWADGQTTDGNLPGVSARWLDRHVGVSGFAEAVAAAGWLEIDTNGIRLSSFDQHNGRSAKKRAQARNRMQAARAETALATPPGQCLQSVALRAQQERNQRREEKRREEKNPPQSARALPSGDAEAISDPRAAFEPRARVAFGRVPRKLRRGQAAFVAGFVARCIDGANPDDLEQAVVAWSESPDAKPEGRQPMGWARWFDEQRDLDDPAAWQIDNTNTKPAGMVWLDEGDPA